MNSNNGRTEKNRRKRQRKAARLGKAVQPREGKCTSKKPKSDKKARRQSQGPQLVTFNLQDGSYHTTPVPAGYAKHMDDIAENFDDLDHEGMLREMQKRSN